jgi:signal transduction histidine kinase
MAGNAARHATSGVSFTLTEHENSAVLAVSNDGPGIPPHQHDRVFERFTRLDDSRQGATGGSGLGLAIAREIIERHGGTLTIDPDHAPGARLVVTLPLHAAPLPPPPPLSDATP